jgi:hypothetical protein
VCALVLLSSCAAHRPSDDAAVVPDARSRHLAAEGLPLPTEASSSAAVPTAAAEATPSGSGSSHPGSRPAPAAGGATAGVGGGSSPGERAAGAPLPSVPTTRAGPATTAPPQSGTVSTAPTDQPVQAGTPAAPGFRVAGSVTDPAGDAGLLVPGYADLVRVTVEDDGTTARVVVDTAGPVPATLAAGEVAGLGVDLFVGDRSDSDYQLFVDGSADGWFAYLHANGGFVAYPGTFRLGGTRLEFEVPWSALGGRAVTRFSAFYDWSQDAFPTNRVGEDHAPLRGTTALQR